jgi:hypothetical protein
VPIFSIVGNGVNVGIMVAVGGTGVEIDVEVGTGVAVGIFKSATFTPQAVRASPAEVTPASLIKSLRESLFLFIIESLLFQLYKLTAIFIK